MPVDGTPIRDPTPDGPTLDVATQIVDSKRWQYVLQALWKAGVPVAVSDTDPQPVSAASLPLPSGAATETSLAGVKTGTDRIPAQGQALAAASLPVVLTALQLAALTAPVLAAGENFVGLSGHGGTVVTGTTQTTDTTLLTNGDAVGSLITFTDIARANGKSFWIVGVKVSASKAAPQVTPQLRLHLFNANNPTLSANNAAFQTKVADFGKRIRSIELPGLAVPADTSNSDDSRADLTPFPILCFPDAASRTIYGALELVSGAYTPTNPVNYAVSLIVEWN